MHRSTTLAAGNYPYKLRSGSSASTSTSSSYDDSLPFDLPDPILRRPATLQERHGPEHHQSTLAPDNVDGLGDELVDFVDLFGSEEAVADEFSGLLGSMPDDTTLPSVLA